MLLFQKQPVNLISKAQYFKKNKEQGVKKMGTEIRTFNSLKEITEYTANQTLQYRSLYEDYSQWLGTLLRDFESAHKNDEWYQKSAGQQKTLKNQSKKTTEATDKGKKSSKGKEESSCWVQSGDIAISYTEQGQTEILFEAIEKINTKIQENDKFLAAIQQLARLGLGTTVNYIVYIEEDVPKKIVLKPKANTKGDEAFKFVTELSISAFYNTTEK
jgi:hypothetical protein